MSTLSGKNAKLFEEFKKEAKIVVLKSASAFSKNKQKKAIRWNGRIFSTTSYRQVFDTVKNELEFRYKSSEIKTNNHERIQNQR